jgi:hypothetical protein
MEPINALAESEDVEGLLFCGTDGGLYTSIDGGFTWSTAHPDLPRVPVHDLVIQERENELVIGTHGRSIWVLDIAPLIDGLTEAADAMPESLPLSMEAPENLTWREGWGERGYGWGEPWTPEVKTAVFLPSAGDHVLQVLDSAQKVVSQTSYSGLERGWQHLTFTPQKVNETEFLGPGAYTLTLQSTDDNAVRFETSWSIEEEEED